MKRLRRNLTVFTLFAGIIILCITGCNKKTEDIPSGRYISFSVDGGSKVEFRSNLDFFTAPPTYPVSSAYYTTGSAYADAANTHHNSISFHINSPQLPKAGQEYTNTNSFEYNASLLYIDDSGIIYTIGKLPDARRRTADTKIKFHNFDERACKGTFSGTLYNYQDTNDSIFIRGQFSFRD